MHWVCRSLMSQSPGNRTIGRPIRDGKDDTEMYPALYLHMSFIVTGRALELCPHSVKKFILRNSYDFSGLGM